MKKYTALLAACLLSTAHAYNTEPSDPAPRLMPLFEPSPYTPLLNESIPQMNARITARNQEIQLQIQREMLQQQREQTRLLREQREMEDRRQFRRDAGWE